MPAESKKQFKYIQSIRSRYGSKAKAPKKFKWAFERGWTDVNYKKLKESETPLFDAEYKRVMK